MLLNSFCVHPDSIMELYLLIKLGTVIGDSIPFCW